MPIRNIWYIEKRVIYSQAIGEVTREEFFAWLDDLEARLADKTQAVHLIQNRAYVTAPYTDLKSTKRLLTIGRTLGGWVLMQGLVDNKLMNFVTSVAVQVAGLRTRPPFEDFESLWQFLSEHDPNLPREALPVPELFSAEEMAPYVTT